MSISNQSVSPASIGADARLMEVEIRGAVDSDYGFPDLPSVALEDISVNWRHVELVNSTGIAKWLKWVTEVRKAQPGVSFTFRNCPSFLVHIVNSVSGFLPKNSRVVSFDVPYIVLDRGTDDIFTSTITLDPRKPAPKTVAEVEELVRAAESLGPDAKIELDTLPSYFNFIFKAK